MHEASIADSILRLAANKMKSTPNTAAVKSVSVIVGEFRNVETESLQFAFDSLKSMYEGLSHCELELESVKPRALCSKNKHHYSPCFQNKYCCDKCGSGIGKIVCGEELEVVKICLLS